MRFALPFGLLGLAATQASAAPEMTVSVEIPQLAVAEYHRPYVAIWVERPDQQAVGNLAIWYDGKLANRRGETWLKDMRQWWRRAGRELQLPIDGVTGATRAPGRHSLRVDAGRGALSALQPGQYSLVVEAAREVGGRELLRIPFQWPPAAAQEGQAQGGHELGAVTLRITP
jgi:hypothetical protein